MKKSELKALIRECMEELNEDKYSGGKYKWILLPQKGHYRGSIIGPLTDNDLKTEISDIMEEEGLKAGDFIVYTLAGKATSKMFG